MDKVYSLPYFFITLATLTVSNIYPTFSAAAAIRRGPAVFFFNLPVSASYRGFF